MKSEHLLLLNILFVCSCVSFSYKPCLPPQIPNGRAKLKDQGRIAIFRCRRRYLMLGSYWHSVCFNGEWFPPQVPKCIRAGCNEDSISPPTNGEVSQQFGGALLEFSCHPGYELVGNLALVCDGRHWNGSVPTCRPTSSSSSPSRSRQCEFTGDLCGWRLQSSSWQWIKSFPTNSSIVQPIHGGFLQLAASNDQTASLVSPVFASDAITSQSCIAMNYFLHGNSVLKGSLRLYQVPDDAIEDPSSGYLLWSKTGDQGPFWHKFKVKPIPMAGGNFRLVIQGVSLNEWHVAVDEFNLSEGPDECVRDSARVEVDQNEENWFSRLSCRNRCGENLTLETAVSHQWIEGYCLCSSLCWTPTSGERNCCQDFHEMCQDLMDTSAEPFTMTTLLPVTGGIVLAGLVSGIGVLLVWGFVWKRLKPRRLASPGSGSMSILDHQEEDMEYCEESEPEMDFRLATVIQLDQRADPDGAKISSI